MRLVVVSNRVAPPDGDEKASAGGLAVALRDALQKHSGVWFGWSGAVAEAPDRVPRAIQRGRVTYRLMDLTPVDRQEYYSGYANRALWPNMHYRVGLTEFSRADLSGYRRVNRFFAEALAPLLRPDDLVWVHDYHLMPLASELRQLGVTNRIGYFHHIPWPPFEVFGTLPGSIDLLEAMCSYDLIGLQTESDAGNLNRSLVEQFGATADHDGQVQVMGRSLTIGSFPIGIDALGFRKFAQQAQTSPQARRTSESLSTHKLVVGVDRLDYTKGLVERVEAFERFLISNPDQRGSVVYLQVAPPSRTEVPEYADLNRMVDQAVGRINGAHSDLDWTPIRFVKKAYSRAVLAGLYRRASVGLVTPMRDGMNLVAKEYVAAQDPEDPGVLILSRFAGAAEQMKDALIVNPFDKWEIAEAIRTAFLMSRQERIRRWERLFDGLEARDLDWWTRSYLDALAGAGQDFAAKQSDDKSRMAKRHGGVSR